MEQKKIALLINSMGLGGAERVVSILLDTIHQKSDITYELILLEDHIFYHIPSHVKVTILSRLDREDSALKRTLFIPYLAYKLYRHCQKNNISLVTSFIYRADFVNVLASYLNHHKVIVSNRVNASSTYGDSTLSSKINRFLIQLLYPKADHIINVSKGIQSDLKNNFGIPQEKQSVIYNPYDVSHIQNLSNGAIPFVLPKEQTMVVVSRLDKVKNIDLILETVAEINKDINLIIVGTGSEDQNLKDLAKALGIDSRVYFTGLENNPYKYMAKSAIYISASHSEGFPNALVEAMICGCAVISTDCQSGPREILAPTSDHTNRLQKGLSQEKYGLLFAVGDKKGLKDAIAFYLNNPENRLKYSHKGYERALDFKKEEVTQKYIDTMTLYLQKESQCAV